MEAATTGHNRGEPMEAGGLEFLLDPVDRFEEFADSLGHLDLVALVVLPRGGAIQGIETASKCASGYAQRSENIARKEVDATVPGRMKEEHVADAVRSVHREGDPEAR